MEELTRDNAVVMRSMSLPDLEELADIQALDDAFLASSSSCTTHKEVDDPPPTTSCPGSPEEEEAHDDDNLRSMRVFSMGLHRSMSMPRQGWMMTTPAVAASSSLESDETSCSSTSSAEEEDCSSVSGGFYIPGDDTDEERSTGSPAAFPQQHSFYSTHRLQGLLPPKGSPALKNHRTKSLSARRQERAVHESSEEEPQQRPKQQRKVRKSERQQPQTATSPRDEAVAHLSAFFFGSTKRKPKVEKSPTSVAAAFAKPERPMSTANTEEEEERHFVKLQHQHRALSMPLPPSPRLPRKPSLKKVSSFVGSKTTHDTNTTPDTDDDNNDNAVVKPSVSFSNLSIREYEVTLGDHPNVSFGPPVSLGWDYRDGEVVEVDQYEERRTTPLRRPHQLLLSYNRRKYLLLKQAGYSKAELREAMEEVNRIKKERHVTGLFAPVDDVMEGVMDTVKTLFQTNKAS